MSILLYSEKYNLTYLSNPKCGCSSIKKSLLDNPSSETNVHDLKNFAESISLDSVFFTVTRNPFSRILSCYTDKIMHKTDLNIWRPFCKAHSLSMNKTLSFYHFLEILNEYEDKAKPSLKEFN